MIDKQTLVNKINETSSVVTHIGDDLDNKCSIHSIQRELEKPLDVQRVPAGTIKEGYVNIDTGGHKGNDYIPETDTYVIDGDPANGVHSACLSLSKIGFYIPEQILQFADNPTNVVSALDARRSLALARHLNGEQTFRLAEEGLLDKSLNDEQLERYGLTEAYKEQQKTIDYAFEKIWQYQIDPKTIVTRELVLGIGPVAYELGIETIVAISPHKSGEGYTFAFLAKRGMELPEELIEVGKRYQAEYGKNVYINPEQSMVVAGGPKNPDFYIPGKVDDIADKITSILKEMRK